MDGDKEPREAILDAAARLFTSLGFSAASTREIATNAGLRQASLFHYFPGKDDILSELLDLTLQPSLDFARRLRATSPPADVGLYLLVQRDVRNLCRGPGNLGSLQLQPIVQQPQFAPFWEKRSRLRDEYRQFIIEGVETRGFAVDDADLATSIVFSLVEGTTLWFSPDMAQSPARTWTAVADSALKAVLREPTRIAEVRAVAAALGDRIDAERPVTESNTPSPPNS
jgi:AcrR family transcriptional regulator